MYLLSVTLESYGLARPVSKKNAPPEMKEMMRGKGRKLLEMSIDRDVAEWMEALGRQSGAIPMAKPEMPGKPRKPKRSRR
jgi:hypothetical protein